MLWPLLIFRFHPSYLKHYRRKRYREAPLGSPCQVRRIPGLRNECSFDHHTESRDVTRQSTGTSSKSSTDTSSTNDKPPRYKPSRRHNSEDNSFTDEKHGYKTERVHNSRRFYQASSSYKDEACMPQKWYRRFEATNGTRPSTKAHYSLSKEGRRLPLMKQNHVQVSYDSGFPEDERMNVDRKMRRSSSPIVTRGSRDGRSAYLTSYRRCHSQYNDVYDTRSFSKYRPERASLNAIRSDDSSDNEVIPEARNRYMYEGSSCDDSEAHSYTLRPRKKRNRPRLPKYSMQVDVPYRHSKGNRKPTHQAIASYQATTDGTIDLYESDKVQVIRKSKGGWWFVRIDDEQGWAPSNYLEPITCHDEWTRTQFPNRECARSASLHNHLQVRGEIIFHWGISIFHLNNVKCLV